MCCQEQANSIVLGSRLTICIQTCCSEKASRASAPGIGNALDEAKVKTFTTTPDSSQVISYKCYLSSLCLDIAQI